MTPNRVPVNCSLQSSQTFQTFKNFFFFKIKKIQRSIFNTLLIYSPLICHQWYMQTPQFTVPMKKYCHFMTTIYTSQTMQLSSLLFSSKGNYWLFFLTEVNVHKAFKDLKWIIHCLQIFKVLKTADHFPETFRHLKRLQETCLNSHTHTHREVENNSPYLINTA